MKAKIIITLAIALGMIGVIDKVQAQSATPPSRSVGEYALSGESLSDINNRNADNDFGYFFMGDKLDSVTDTKVDENNRAKLQNAEESLSQKNRPTFVVPESSYNGNDGAQVQVDLTQ